MIQSGSVEDATETMRLDQLPRTCRRFSRCVRTRLQNRVRWTMSADAHVALLGFDRRRVPTPTHWNATIPATEADGTGPHWASQTGGRQRSPSHSSVVDETEPNRTLPCGSNYGSEGWGFESLRALEKSRLLESKEPAESLYFMPSGLASMGSINRARGNHRPREKALWLQRKRKPVKTARIA